MPHTQPAISSLATTASRFYRIDRAQVSTAGLHPQPVSVSPTLKPVGKLHRVSCTSQACSPQLHGHNILTCLWLWITCPHPPGTHSDGANRKSWHTQKRLSGWVEGRAWKHSAIQGNRRK